MKYLKWYGIAILAFVGLSAGTLGIKAALFPVSVAHTALNSAGNIVSKTLDANNVLHSYEWFYDVSAAIEARRGQIAAHASLVGDEQDRAEKSRLNMELAAMSQSCRDLTTKYNANSEKANKSIFKSNGLPVSIDISTCEA